MPKILWADLRSHDKQDLIDAGGVVGLIEFENARNGRVTIYTHLSDTLRRKSPQMRRRDTEPR